MFQELLRNPTGRHPGNLQRDSTVNFKDVIRSSSLRLLDHPLSALSDDVVLGIASYSQLDLNLLDQFNDNSHRWNSDFKIYAIDLASIDNINEIYRLCPMIDLRIPLRLTPFALLEFEGQLQFLQGADPIISYCKKLNILN